MSKVTAKMLAEENEIYNEFVEIPVFYEEKEHFIKVYPYFSPEKVRDSVDSLFKFYQKAKEENIAVPEEEGSDIIAYFVVRYFTDIAFSRSKKAKVLYKEFKQVLNSKVFKTVVETFPHESLKEVYERIYQVNDMAQILELQSLQRAELIENFNGEGKQKLMSAMQTKDEGDVE